MIHEIRKVGLKVHSVEASIAYLIMEFAQFRKSVDHRLSAIEQALKADPSLLTKLLEMENTIMATLDSVIADATGLEDLVSKMVAHQADLQKELDAANAAAAAAAPGTLTADQQAKIDALSAELAKVNGMLSAAAPAPAAAPQAASGA